MKLKHIIFGERSLTKIAAVFENRDSAEHAAEYLTHAGMISDSQVNLVGPGDLAGPSSPPLSRKLEPEPSGIWHTLIRAHVFTGTLGAILGVLLYIGLMLSGNDAIQSTPYLSLFIMIFFGTTFGLLFGGLLTLRPDHYRVASLVRRAVAKGRWAVVTHPATHEQTEFVLDELHHRSDHVVRSF
ncbi:MAG: hypothetical protein IV085_00290 [Thiobacillus sp.]|nr:hypothetical protein [Thiobacillus sp.]